MKWIAGFFAVVLLAMPLGFAQTNGNKISAGVTPDSFLYGLDVALDEIRYLMTLDTDGKARLGLEVAEERLQEVKEMLLQNNLEASEKAQNEHAKALGRLKNDVSKISRDNTTEELEDVVEIESELEEHENEIQIINELRVQIKVKGSITAEQQELIDNIVQQLENKTGEVKIEIENKKNSAKIRIRAETGKTREEVDIETEEIEERVLENKIEKLEAKGEKAEDQIEDAEELIEECKAKIGSDTASSVLMREAEKHLENAKAALAEGKSGRAFGQANSAEQLAKNACKQRGNETTPTPPSNQTNQTLNGTVSGMKFDDKNSNGAKDANETGLSNWTIYVDKNSNGVLDENDTSMATDGSGSYLFALTPGNYTIREVQKDGWTRTTAEAVNVTVVQNSTVTANFGNFQAEVVAPANGSISGMKFEDANGNGAKDGGEAGLANWTIQLYRNGSFVAADVTDGSGLYSFANLTAGAYNITEVMQSGWISTKSPQSVTIEPRTVSQNNDFGNFHLGSISGMKFNDVDGNGTKDAGEEGLANWTIQLTGPLSNTTITTTTDAGGNYSFTGLLAGTYTISELLQEGWNQTMPAGNYTVQITSGTAATTKDFGNQLLNNTNSTV